MVKTNPKVDTENEKSYLTIEEFNAIRKMDLPKDFLDFFEVGFRTGLRATDILNLKKENVKLKKDDNGNSTGRIHGTALKTKSQTQINIRLDQKSLSILKDRLENTKSDFLFSNKSGDPYTIEYFKKYFRKAFDQLYPDVKFHKSIHAIRSGNRKFLEMHNVNHSEIDFRQCLTIYGPTYTFMVEQSASVNVINKYLK
ncbi:tyrosine-type recombinase/integrase [Anaerostipes hadrus]|uniref:tyrosine-type recombinase/integrase n=1 Tax=Anaerostipes hadrus TaxID=649756 RepID=UPI00156E9C1F|nr:tyrosine-type recombinase/integrase [Anaerostipes hadrus]NSH12268.1 tyrosine-type recombinase/integrase [Anaerostipes hadrus]NSH21101.1 tyrosine-type recombinase/integrase [Anaerostipes hadrus]NSH35388.1 tyrosine-type recombinase/integrase [Anaerostipes hadrus]NSH56514.1 tyrosine-type recombinase/integrase [Anaerostipes hadrus]